MDGDGEMRGLVGMGMCGWGQGDARVGGDGDFTKVPTLFLFWWVVCVISAKIQARRNVEGAKIPAGGGKVGGKFRSFRYKMRGNFLALLFSGFVVQIKYN